MPDGLTDTQRAAIFALDRDRTTLRRPNEVGETIWGSKPGAYSGVACSAPYARPAGKVLKSLQKRGLAEWIVDGDNHGWRLTWRGLDMQKKLSR